MSEGAFEQSIVEYAAECGFFARKMKYLGRRGCPDRWFFGHGEIIIIEFKAIAGRLHVLQKLEHDRYRKAGITVYVVKTREQAERIFGRYV